MTANVTFVEAEINTEPYLAREAVVILPCVAQQHGECHFVARTQLRDFSRKFGTCVKPFAVAASAPFRMMFLSLMSSRCAAWANIPCSNIIERTRAAWPWVIPFLCTCAGR